jgi:multidrug efflux pump subunit AcrA (membrane-fusion protein)
MAAIRHLKWYILRMIVLLASGMSTFLWLRRSTDTTEDIASGNGRIEAVEVDITAKYSNRLVAILAKEGGYLTKGEDSVSDTIRRYRISWDPRVFDGIR